jgi:hypothetical protein
MSNYLVVAHQTANSPEVADTLLGIKEQDPEAQFVLLVPATRTEELRKRIEDDSRSNAERVATRALYSLHEEGVDLLRVSVGDESPLVAIQQELVSHPDFYKEVIISTLPVDFSKWLSMDIPEKVKATFEIPVRHIHGYASVPE